MISLEKQQILTSLQKLSNNVGNLGKLIVAKGFKKLPKVQKIANLVTLVPTYLIFSVKFQASRIFLDASFTLR